MDKELRNKIINAREEIKNLQEQMEQEIENTRPNLKLTFLTTKELVDNDNPIEAKSTQNKIKKELVELNKLLLELWK